MGSPQRGVKYRWPIVAVSQKRCKTGTQLEWKAKRNRICALSILNDLEWLLTTQNHPIFYIFRLLSTEILGARIISLERPKLEPLKFVHRYAITSVSPNMTKWQTTLMGMVTITWTILELWRPNEIFGMGETTHFKFGVQIDNDTY